MKAKVTKIINKQNLEHFQMINWILLSHKFCNNSKMLLSSSWAIFIGAVMFSFSPRANFSSLKYLSFSFLLVFQFILIEYERVLTEKQLYYHKDWEVPIMLYYVLIQQNTVTCFSDSIRNHNAMTSEIRAKDNLWRKLLGEILKGFFVEIYRCPGWNIFQNLINGGCGIRMSWMENFLKINKRRGDVY